MARLIAGRVVALVPLLLIVSFGVFALTQLVPGDPARTLAGGVVATPEQIAAIRERLHLDEPMLSQYLRWLGHAVRLDFGESFYSGRSVAAEIAERLPVTLGLIAASLAVTLGVGIPVGIVAGLRAGRPADRVSRYFATLAISIPEFVLAVVLIIVVAVEWRLLPASGFERFSSSPTEWLRYMVLPALALGLGGAARLSRQLRAGLVDVLDSNYVRAVWASGADHRSVAWKHALRNASIASITVLGLQVGFLLGGTVIVEQIFSIPGLGSYFLRAVTSTDVPVIQAVSLVFVVWMVVLSLAVDVAYGLVNPKVRVG
jgi:peptide/nickel transport system permease protein